MPADRKFTFEKGDQKIEAEVPSGWHHQSDLKDTHVEKSQFASELDRRVQEITKNRKTPDELLSDEGFLKTVATTKKDPILKILNIEPSRVDLDVQKMTSEITDRVTREVVSPLENKAKELEAENSFLRDQSLDAEAIQAAVAMRVPEDMQDLVKLFIRQHSKYDPASKRHFIKKLNGQDGFELSSDPQKNGHPYMTPRELLEREKRSGNRKSWFNVASQAGPGFESGPGHEGELTLDQFKKMTGAQQTAVYQKNPEVYNSFMEAIRQEGENALFAKSGGNLYSRR